MLKASSQKGVVLDEVIGYALLFLLLSTLFRNICHIPFLAHYFLYFLFLFLVVVSLVANDYSN